MACKWRTGSNGTIGIPGRIDSMPCPVLVTHSGTPDSGNESPGQVKNLTAIRLYYAGGSGWALPADWPGILAPGEVLDIGIRFPWVAWFIPEHFQHSYLSTVAGLAEKRELDRNGYQEWKQKHYKWSQENLWPKVAEVFSGRKPIVKRVDPPGGGLRKLQAE